MEFERKRRKSCCSTKLGMVLILILLLIALPACTTQEVPKKTKQGQEEVQGEQNVEKNPEKEKTPLKEASENKTQREEQITEEQADNASIMGIPRFFQRRESARVTHISDDLINMSYRENNRQVQFKVVNLEQDDGIRKRTVKYCFDKDSIFFKKRDILTYHISTEVCNTHGKPYVALPIKIERER